MNHLYSMIGARVKKERRQLGLSQDGLAERAGLSRASISNIEAGRQQLYVHHLVSLADALRIEASVLLASSMERDEEASVAREQLAQTFRSGTIEKPKKRRGQ